MCPVRDPEEAIPPWLEVWFLPHRRKPPCKKKIIAISLRPTPHPIIGWESGWGPHGPGHTVENQILEEKLYMLTGFQSLRISIRNP